MFDLLEQNDLEIEFRNILVCSDRIFELIASIKEASNKNENNEVSLILNRSSTSKNNADKVVCKYQK